MDFIDFDFSWRDAIIALIALLGVYLVFQLLRLTQARQRSQRMAESKGRYANEPADALVEFSGRTADMVAQYAAAIEDEEERRREPVVGTQSETPLLAVQDEIYRLQEELQAARKEISHLQEEVGVLQAQNGTSPLYSEAMSMAARGLDAAGIAGRCGISIAEAELVVALARKPQDRPST